MVQYRYVVPYSAWTGLVDLWALPFRLKVLREGRIRLADENGPQAEEFLVDESDDDEPLPLDGGRPARPAPPAFHEGP